MLFKARIADGAVQYNKVKNQLGRAEVGFDKIFTLDAA